MTYDLRWVLVLLANLLLIVLVAELNHYLALVPLYVYVGGLLLTFGMLRLQLRQGFLANGITALVLDALNPFPFGLTLFLILLCHTVVVSLRGHFARENLRSGLLVAAGVNLILMLAYAFFAARGVAVTEAFWSRLAIDSALSTAVVVAIAPWYLSLQKSALAFVGIDLDAEQREAK